MPNRENNNGIQYHIDCLKNTDCKMHSCIDIQKQDILEIVDGILVPDTDLCDYDSILEEIEDKK